jgi:hypothetical protein
MHSLIDKIDAPSGSITAHLIDEQTNQKTDLFTQPNQIQVFWAYSVAKAWGQGDPSYKPGAIYFEYKNVVSSGDLVAVPTYVRTDGLSYYNTLASPYDFLRIPLSSLPLISIQSGYEASFTDPEGNVLSFFAQTAEATGILGRTFSDSVNSKVFGVALVATPTWSDRTKDILIARTYFSTGQQQLKLSGSQIGVTWKIPLL